MSIMKNVFRDLTIIIALFLIIVGIAFVSDMISAKEKNYNGVVQQDKSPQEEQADLSFVSSTEYTSHDTNGSTIVKLRDSHNNFINTTCWETILYPDRSVYFPTTEMYQDLFYGEYFMNFEIPNITGVYSQEVVCVYKNKNISQAKAFHISVLGDRILSSTNSLNGTLEEIKSALNCTNPSLNRTCELLNQINGSQTTNFYNTNLSLSQITSIVTSINDTIAGFGKVYYQVSAPDCQVGTQWVLEGNVSNEEGEILPFLDCTLTTSVFGSENVPYIKSINRYRIVHSCSPAGITNWDFDCVKT